MRTQFGPALKTLGLPGSPTDDDQTQARRATLLSIVGVTGNDHDVQRRARELAQMYIENPASLPPTLAAPVLQVAAISGDEALYDRYMAELQKAKSNPEEYYRFFNALPMFSNPALVKRTIDFAASAEVRTQDTGGLLARLMNRSVNRDATWAFIKVQWQTLTEKLGTFQGIPEIVASVGAFCSTEAATDVRQFFAAHPVPSSERGIQQGLERIETCAAVANRQAAPLTRWLASAR